MREILFRGKNVDNGEWIYGDYAAPFAFYPANIFKQDGNFEGIAVVPETVGQFTGLTDKNGRKIFEGDILKANNGHIGYVAFSEGGFVKACRCHFNFTNLYGDNQEVIGNIHDNPELIGGEEN